MASRGASLFAFFFCNEKKKGGVWGAAPDKKEWYALKRRQGEKCYFSPCAFISKSYQQLLSYSHIFPSAAHTA